MYDARLCLRLLLKVRNYLFEQTLTLDKFDEGAAPVGECDEISRSFEDRPVHAPDCLHVSGSRLGGDWDSSLLEDAVQILSQQWRLEPPRVLAVWDVRSSKLDLRIGFGFVSRGSNSLVYMNEVVKQEGCDHAGSSLS